MMYLCLIFISPLYFLFRKKWIQFAVNLVLWGLAWLFLISIVFSFIAPIFWILAVGHASFNFRYEMMERHATIMATKMVEKMQQGQIVVSNQTPVTTALTAPLPTPIAHSQQLFIHRDGQNHGPYSFDEVRSYLANGTILSSELAWYEGAASWVPLSQIPGVAIIPPPPSPPPAVASPVTPATPLMETVASKYLSPWLAYGIPLGLVAIIFLYVAFLWRHQSTAGVNEGIFSTTPFQAPTTSSSVVPLQPSQRTLQSVQASALSGQQSAAAVPVVATPFKGQRYCALDHSSIITLTSPDELELGENNANLICKYSKDGDTLRVVITVMGTLQAVYYRIIDQGLQGNDGKILYDPAHLEIQQRLAETEARKTRLAYALFKACADLNVDEVRSLISQGAVANDLRGNQYFPKVDMTTPLMITTSHLNLNGFSDDDYEKALAIDKILLENGADPNVIGNIDMQRITPLFIACMRGRIEMAKLLIDHGANPHAVVRGQGFVQMLQYLWAPGGFPLDDAKKQAVLGLLADADNKPAEIPSSSGLNAQADQASPPVATPTLTVYDNLRNFITKHISSESARDLDACMNDYGERVDYFNYGMVDNNYIRNDHETYFKLWPKRTEIINGEMQFHKIALHDWSVDFVSKIHIENGLGDWIEGDDNYDYKIQFIDNKPLIISQKVSVTHELKGNSNAPSHSNPATSSSPVLNTTQDETISQPQPLKRTFRGILAAFDATRATFNVDCATNMLTLFIVPTTNFKLNGNPAKLEDFAMGDHVAGSYVEDDAGRMTAFSVNKKTQQATEQQP